jgi:hypothetical protein
MFMVCVFGRARAREAYVVSTDSRGAVLSVIRGGTVDLPGGVLNSDEELSDGLTRVVSDDVPGERLVSVEHLGAFFKEDGTQVFLFKGRFAMNDRPYLPDFPYVVPVEGRPPAVTDVMFEAFSSLKKYG